MRIYLTGLDPYTTVTPKGSWTVDSGIRRQLSFQRPDWRDQFASVEATGQSEDVLLYLGVSGPLAAQTISGTVDFCVLLGCSSALGITQHPFAHVYLWVTVGDTDVVRGVLLSDTVSTNQLTFSGYRGEEISATLSDVVVSDGDRLVAEIGFTEAEGVKPRIGQCLYGNAKSYTALGPVNEIMEDAVVDRTYRSSLSNIHSSIRPGASWLDFSATLLEPPILTQVGQVVIETISKRSVLVTQAAHAIVETATKQPPGYTENAQMVIEVVTLPFPDNDLDWSGGGGIIFGGGAGITRTFIPPAIICRVWPIGHIKFPCPDEGETLSRCPSPEQELQNDMD